MASNSTQWPSTQSLDYYAASSLSGQNANQVSNFLCHETGDHEQNQHQAAENTVADSEADSEAEFRVTLPEHNFASEGSCSAVTAPDGLDRFCREYDEVVNQTYRQATTLLQSTTRPTQEMNERSIPAKRRFRSKQSAHQSSNGQRQRKRLREEHDRMYSEDPGRPSSFLASIRTWRKKAGKCHPSETYFQIEGISDAKQDKWGNIKIKTHWVPIWVPIQHLRGDESYEAAKELVTRKFGEDVWTKASDGRDAVEPYAKGCIDYATE